MKRKYTRRKNKVLSKKNGNPTIDIFFKSPQQLKNIFKISSTKKNVSPLMKTLKNINNSNLCIIRNPSKTKIFEETQQELKKFHNLAKKTILCNDSLIDILYFKLCPYFEKIEKYLSSNKKCDIKNISKKELVKKFILQLKYTNIVYIAPSLLSERFNEDNISQNIRNFIGFNNFKEVVTSFLPNTKKECQMFWPNITEIISNYLNDFHEGKGLYLYVKHDYISYLDKIKLLCNLNNYETCVIEESNESKSMILDKLSEAMQTKRLPSISEQLGAQMLMLEEMVNSFSFKWKIFMNKNEENNDKNIDDKINLSNSDNNLSDLSFNFSIEKNEQNIKSSKDFHIILDDNELNSKGSSTIEIKDNNDNNDNKIIRIEEDIKNDQLSTNETLFNNYKKKENKNSVLKECPNPKNSKSKDKKLDKNKNSRNKSSEFKKKQRNKNKKNLEDNNKNIKGYFNENTKEHKTFIQLQNNIFFYCTKAKTAIIIVDSLSDEDKDKKYFNNILSKISQTKCPIIVLTNNLDYAINNPPKKIKNLNINCILYPKNRREIKLIYLYNFIICLNIKLCSFKFNKKIRTYNQILELVNKLDNDICKFDLCITNLKKIYDLSEFFCYNGKFQIDIIDLRLSEAFLQVENKINEKVINADDFESVLNYIYNDTFPNKNKISNHSEEKNIDDIYEEYELKSFLDYSEGIQNDITKKNYENKISLNDSFDNYFKSKDSMVNMEDLVLDKFFIKEKTFTVGSDNNNNEIKKNFSFYESINNKIINKIHKEDQLVLSKFKNKFIELNSINNYIYPIKRKMIIYKNLNKYQSNLYLKNIFNKKSEEESNDFIDVHNYKKLFQKIDDIYFFNKNNINYASNYMIKKEINQRKIVAELYSK